ncbi:MAG TPA: hypothetical protein VLH08_11145 [Acidobacteriota bacterium]|nr:hypothetical protein [Acidobacteriota bacterium]
MFFQTISELGNAKRLFIVQTGQFPNFRTVMYYYPNDTVVTVRSKKRATVANASQYSGDT